MVEDSELTEAVASLKGWDSARVLSATAEDARASSGSATRSVTLIHGTAVGPSEGDAEEFSVVRKVLWRDDGLPAWDRRHWRRELLAYRSGFLPAGKAGLTTCRLLSAHEDGDGARLWLLPAPDEPTTRWTLATFGSVAAQLGRWHARHLDDSFDVDWLVRDQLAQRIERTDSAGGLVQPDWDTPSLSKHFSRQLIDSSIALWEGRHRALAARRELPRTIAHGDFSRGNLCVVTGSETVVIDWATLGTAPVGADLVELVISAFECLPSGDRPSLIKTIVGECAEAMAGGVDRRDVELGFALTFGPVAASRLCWTLNRDASAATAEMWATVVTQAREALDAVYASWPRRSRSGSS